MSITIFSWNVNGLRAIERKNALTWINIQQPTILCLQETKLSLQKEFKSSLEDKYPFTFINNSTKKGFSGTATYSNYKASHEDTCNEIDFEFDGRIIIQYYDKLALLNVYFPNGKWSQPRFNYKINFYEKLFLYCNQLKEEGYSIIICGDFNTAYKEIDCKKTKINNKAGFSDLERDYFDKFIQNGYIDTYRYFYPEEDNAYTWWSYRANGRLKKEGWRIDYILVSEDLKENLVNAFILNNILGSDHCPIGIELNILLP